MPVPPLNLEQLRSEAHEFRMRSQWIDSDLACLTHAGELVEHCSVFLSEVYALHEVEENNEEAASRMACCLGRIVISAQMVADCEAVDLSQAIQVQLYKWRSRLDSISD
jgi:hypothetical protein